ncbi:MAG: CPBP family intramembrane metalloprotease [Devosia nanyangense]|uniref:CPBP family intramembrane metalloprotease n=1 Tax=Devosia nanyangense TaxID=1228055 RepID=A0A933L1L5_9HYPH|nr:CPBP family intramembrane metalloprotease [Devosia nanyangense]
MLLALTTFVVIPWLRDHLGVAPVMAWFLSGTCLVLLPVLLFGLLMARRELPNPTFAALLSRLRLKPLNRGDWIWTAGGMIMIAACSGLIVGVARLLDPSFRPSPWFLVDPPGLSPSLLASWLPLFVSNILGEELGWRGYLLPRQEAALGRRAWLANGLLWCLFHWSFGWQIMLTLLPTTLLLPWIVQRRQNTTVGIVVHGVFNAAAFLAVVSVSAA